MAAGRAGAVARRDAALTQGSPADMRARVLALPGGASWVAEFDAFLAVYGQRTEETCRIDTPSWIEDPSPALYSIGTFLAKPSGFDFHAARAAAMAERDGQIDQARRSVNGSDLARFNEALASNQAANFAWWNEEHNYLIDRRAAIPVRRATLELGARLADAGRISDPRHVLPVQAGAVRGHGVGRRGPVGGPGGDDPGPAGLLRALARARAVAADHARHDPRHGARPDHDRGVRAVRSLP